MSGHREQPGAPGPSLLRRFIFWEFARASWQYDVVVGLILIFIFAMPRAWFNDQPRAASVVLLSASRDFQRVYIEPDLLNNVPEGQRLERAAELIRQRTGKRPKVVRIEAIRDQAEGEVKGFIAYTTR